MAMLESRVNAADGRSDCTESVIHTDDVNLYSENKNRAEAKQIAREKTPCIGCVSANTTCSGMCERWRRWYLRRQRAVLRLFGVEVPEPEALQPISKCVCDCGKEITVPGQYLRSGQTRSCGCDGKRGEEA